MTCCTRLTVLVHDPSNDGAAGCAMTTLGELAGAGLTHPLLIVCAPSGAVRAVDGTRDESIERLMPELAGRGAVAVAQVVTVATDCLDSNEQVDAVRRQAEEIVATLRSHQPADARVLDIRILSVSSFDSCSSVARLATPHADANLVVLPDDRPSDDHFGVPVGPDIPDAYGAHLGAEIANQVGLWRGMTEAAVDHGTKGVIGHNDAKVVVTRSYARLLLGPPAPLAAAVSEFDSLPRPGTLEDAVAPTQATTEFAQDLLQRLRGLSFTAPEPYEPQRVEMGVWDSARELGGEALSYLRDIPRALRSGVAADLEHLSAEALSAAVGEDARLRVVWAGTSEPSADDTIEAVVQHVAREVARREEIPDASGVDEEVWTQLVLSSIGVADGGPLAPGVSRPDNHGRPAYVAAPAILAPSVSGGADDVREQIASAAFDAKADLLTKIAAGVRIQIDHARAALQRSRDDLERARRAFDKKRLDGLGILSWVLGGLVASLFVAIVVFSGAAELIGVDTWTRGTRTAVGLVLGAIALGITALAAIGAFRNGGNSRLLIVVVGILLASAALAWLLTQSLRLRLPSPLDGVRLGDLLLFFTVIAIMVITAVLAGMRHTPAGDAAARIVGATAIVYVALSIIGGAVRNGTWYSGLTASQRLDAVLRMGGALLILVLLVLGLIAWFRVRERLRLRDEAARLRWAAAAALDVSKKLATLRAGHEQLVGTAVAIGRFFWLPFGAPPSVEDVRPEDPDHLCPAQKARLRSFDLPADARAEIVARIRHQLAKPGWIQHQYEEAVLAFRPIVARQHGLDPREVAGIRPEHDPHVHATTDGPALQGTVRWRFAELLYSGAFDPALRGVLTQHTKDALYAGYVDRSFTEFAEELVAGTAPHLPIGLFQHLDLPVANDDRIRFHTTLWWPKEAIEPPHLRANEELRQTEVFDAGEQGLIVVFVRTDWSEPLPLSRMPFRESQAVAPTPPDEPDVLM